MDEPGEDFYEQLLKLKCFCEGADSERVLQVIVADAGLKCYRQVPRVAMANWLVRRVLGFWAVDHFLGLLPTV